MITLEIFFPSKAKVHCVCWIMSLSQLYLAVNLEESVLLRCTSSLSASFQWAVPASRVLPAQVLLCLGVVYYYGSDCVEEFDCNAWGAEHPALWMLSDSGLPFNLAAARWWFLWDSLRLAFPTVLWLEGDWESGWSRRTGFLIVCLETSVKISE